MTNKSSPCQDLSNTYASSRKVTAPNLVEMGGMNMYKDMAGLGTEPWTPASLVRCPITELSRPISTVHLAKTTTHVRKNTPETSLAKNAILCYVWLHTVV